MSKARYKYGYLFILAAVGMAVIFLLVHGKTLFGSDVDWISQHSVFPDYFRKLFYETGELYPDFAMGIGGGQNIFNFAYYGLLNPCILLSYLFPWIPMDLWIMGLSLVLYVVSVFLFYYWITTGRKIDDHEICCGITLIFMLAAPLLYHSCVQIMFVNYMPFLCMGLIGTDRYFEQQKAGLLCISVTFMILTSFYFSIGGIGCLCLYGLYCYVERTEDITAIGILSAALRYVFIIFIGILLSGFFLVPTAVALLNGRDGESEKEIIDVLSLFLPLGETKRILYDVYGMGLGCLSLMSVTAGIFRKKPSEKILSISLFLVTMFPVVTYALNGFLYNRGKALIPFVPLVCFQTGLWISSLKESRRGTGIASIFILIYFWVTLKENGEYSFYLIDFALVVVSVIIYCRWKQKARIIIVPSVIILLLVMSINCGKEDAGMEISDLNLEKREKISQMIEEISESDHSLYRMEYYGDQTENFRNINRIFHVDQNITSIYSSTFNPFYSTLRNEIFDVEKPNRNILMEGLVENAVFRKMMGVKYIISETQPVGYKEEAQNPDDDNKLDVYVDETVAPLVYGTSKLLDRKAYEKMEFPYNQLAFLYYAVVRQDMDNGVEISEKDSGKLNSVEDFGESALKKDFGKSTFSKDFGELDSIDISGEIEGTPQGEITVKIPKSDEERIFFVQFHVKNKRNKDVVVKVGTSQNNLCSARHIYYNGNTEFSYAVAVAAGQEELLFDFGKGEYEISDSKTYLTSIDVNSDLYEYKFFQEQSENTGAEKWKKSTSNVLRGMIDMKKDGYLVTSIPYDEHFTVLIDGKEEETELVNEGFLGVKLGQGNHEIAIQYQSPGKMAGICLTLCGALLALMYCGYMAKRQK